MVVAPSHALARQLTADASPVVGLIGQRGRLDLEVEALHGLVQRRVVGKGQRDPRGRFLRRQAALQRLLRRDRDP